MGEADDDAVDYLMETCFACEGVATDENKSASEDRHDADVTPELKAVVNMYNHLHFVEPSHPFGEYFKFFAACHKDLFEHALEHLPDLSDAGRASVLYTVRLLLDEEPSKVCDAVEQALLHGQTGTVDREMQKKVFVAPRPLAPEWLRRMSDAEHSMMPEASRKEYAALHLMASGSLGLRPLTLDDVCTQETPRSGWNISTVQTKRALLMNDPQKTGGPMVCPEMERECSMILATDESGPAPATVFKRVFLVVVISANHAASLKLARHSRGLPDSESVLKDGAIVCRCTVRAVRSNEGEVRTELVRELLDQWPVVSGGMGKVKFQKAGSAFFVREPLELILKLVAHMLEEEARIWIATHGLRLVEVSRGVHRHEASILAGSKLTATCYCLTPGDGALSPCEQTCAPFYNPELAEKLATQFPVSEMHDPNRGPATEHHLAEGSVDILSFAAVIDRICRRAERHVDIFRKFVDLGSGEGLAVLAAAQLFPFRACLGIELVLEQVDRARARAMKLHTSEPRDLFLHGDIFDNDWSDASVVFCNAVTWLPPMLAELGKRATRLRPGSVFLMMNSLGQYPPHPDMFGNFLVRVDACLVSWHDFAEKVWVFQRV